MALHKEIPFLRIIVPLCAGIITTLYADLSRFALIITIVIILIPLLTTTLNRRKNENILFGFALTISLTLLGNILFSLEKKNITELRHEEQLFQCILEDFPEKRENGYRAKVSLQTSNLNDSVMSVKGSMLLYVRSDSVKTSLKPGDAILIRCMPERITNRGNPYEFDYKFYMENQGFKFMAFLNEDDITALPSLNRLKLKHRALIVRENIIDMYRQRGIEGRNLALVAAMTVGEKTLLEPDQKETFIKAGVMHIMAVSGLHAIVLSMFIFNMLFFLKGRLKILKIIIAIVALWAFAFVTGLTPSVMRATLMFSCLQIGNIIKRPVNSMNSVLASAFVLILIKPSVIFDSGFLLSYFAVIFIIAFYKDMYMLFSAKTWLSDQIWQSTVVTFVAQAGVLPLTIMFFNRFPIYFLITNLIIVPLSSLIIIVGCIIPIVYPIVFLSKFLAAALDLLTSFTEFLTITSASIPCASIERIGMTMTGCILSVVIISLFMFWITKKDGKFLNLTLFFILIMAIYNLAATIHLKNTNELIVYNVSGKTVIGIRTGSTMNLFSSDTATITDVNRHCSALGLNQKLTKLHDTSAYIEVSGKKIVITNEINAATPEFSESDFIILTGQRPIIRSVQTLQFFRGTTIVSSSAYQRFRLPNDIASKLQYIQYVRVSGSYRKAI